MNADRNIILSDIKRIKEASDTGNLVVFVGAGLSMSSGMPSWGKLINEFKEELSSQIQKESDYLKIAQIYRNYRGQSEYLKKIKEIFYEGNPVPNELHDLILQLNPAHIITTNYDDLIEQAIDYKSSNYFVITKDEDLPKSPIEKYLLKMHGDLEEGNIVLTEQDYLDYKDNFPLIRSLIQSLVATKTILFIGFSFSDYNLKIITNMVMKALGNKFPYMYMLDHNIKEYVELEYLKKRGVKVIPYQTWFNDFSNGKTEENLPIDKKLSSTLNFIINSEKRVKDFSLQAFLLELIQYKDAIFKNVNYIGSKGILNILNNKWGLNVRVDDYQIIFYDSFILDFNQNFVKNRWKYREEVKLIITLYKFLTSNGVSYIKLNNPNFQIEGEKNIYKYYKPERDKTPYKFTYYKWREIKIRYEALRENPYKSTGVDLLEYPYILYKLGYYYYAIKELEKLRKRFVRNNQPVLLLFSLYNIKQLLKLVKNESFEDAKSGVTQQNIEDLSNNLGNVEAQIKEVLSKMSSSSTDKFLVDLYNKTTGYGLVYDVLNNLQGVREKARESYRSYLAGGGNSMNFHNMAYFQLYEIENWMKDNYLVSDVFIEHIQTHAIAFEIFIILHKASRIKPIKTPLFAGMQKLKELGFEHLRYSLELDTQDLKKLFRANQIDDVIVSKKCIQELKNIFNTFFDNYINSTLDWNFKEEKNTFINNLLFIIVKLKSRSELFKHIVSKLVKVQNQDFGKLGEGQFFDYLVQIASKVDLKGMTENADNLIEKLISVFGLQKQFVNELMLVLVLHLRDLNVEHRVSGKLLNAINNEPLDTNMKFHLYYSVYENKRINKEQLLELEKSIIDLRENGIRWMVIINGLIYDVKFSSNFILELLSEFESHFESRRSFSFEDDIYYAIKLISKKYKSKPIIKKLDSLKKQSLKLHFVISPSTFNNFEKIDRNWLFRKEITKPYMNNSSFKRKVKELIDDNPEDIALKNFYISIF